MLAMARRDIHISGIKDARHNHAMAPRDQELDFMSVGYIRQVTKGASDMTVLVIRGGRLYRQRLVRELADAVEPMSCSIIS
jgi:putative component of toxin-antitoxin plasmid stabilization module